ncbi:hypothetical protein RB412 [Rhodopirellula baltica SH 1]|uniref:Uncharacterized protein n=1 Tax=Rhodopirellula baltica (strain DSM 10527 / NCIMB 13988 / SH1) TaxID=243090 RepID=Q7UYS4_RHOBA|nr:hypothetical protein RB412 [Rhodopirellula baltica SH 1]
MKRDEGVSCWLLRIVAASYTWGVQPNVALRKHALMLLSCQADD